MEEASVCFTVETLLKNCVFSIKKHYPLDFCAVFQKQLVDLIHAALELPVSYF